MMMMMISDGIQPGGSYFRPSKKWEFPGWILGGVP